MKPIKNTTKTPLSFDERLKLVKAEIRARVSALPPKQQNPKRAGLWVRWINKTILEVQP